MLSDRDTGVLASRPQSVWTAKPGDWKGSLVWGDNHAEFAQTCDGFATRYESPSGRSSRRT